MGTTPHDHYIALALVVVLFTALGALAGWKVRGTWDEIGAAYAIWSGGDNTEAPRAGRTAGGE